ncbi:MAG: PEGA domain-containing protein [Candidatus Eremiobacteraeota bacterium]|nr:PEGA domain-containing protein [Candidatus Eremiobacteraeota bacterium]
MAYHKRWLSLLLVVGACWACALTAGSGMVHGGLYVTSLPSGAAVWMDGAYLGTTPLLADAIDSGRHTITLIHGGWSPQTAYADVSAGHIATVSLVLAQTGGTRPSARAKGLLVVRSSAGSKVQLDGVAFAAGNDAQPVDAGDHILSVSKPGAPREMHVVHVYPQVTTVISAAATVATPPAGPGDDDMLALLDQYVPVNSYTMSGDVITVHLHGVELECAIGSKTYMLNGRPGTLGLAPALLGKRAYLPLSLLKRISGADKPASK